MPWNVQTDAGKRTEREILKFPVGIGAIRSVVIKASAVAARSSNDPEGYSNRRVLLRGQLLAKDTVDTTKYVPYVNNTTPGPCVGVLDNDVEFIDGTAGSNEAANMIFFGAIFDKDKLIGYTGNEANVATSLPTCRFE